MITNICAGDWLQFQHIEQGELVTAEGYVAAPDPDLPKWVWVGDRIVADSNGKQIGTIIVLDHKPADPDDLQPDDPTDRIARAIAEADDNSRPGCVYVKLAEAAMAAGCAK